MALQSVVNSEYALGTPGCKATPDQSIYTVENYFVGDQAGVAAGTFAWIESGVLTNTNTGSGTFAGFVQRDVYYPAYTLTEGGMVIPEGESVTVAKKGDYYAQMATSCTAGQTVYATTSGTLTVTSASGVADTGWKVAIGAASGGTCVISNW